MMSALERRVVVGRLRIRSHDGDALRARLGMDRVLGSADIRPGRLPPAAILVVRSLADPLPGVLDPSALVPSPVWQRAVAAALDDRAACAARPVSGAVPADAEAVVFLDRGELLACLGRDWCDGSLGGCWWWTALELGSSSRVLEAFVATPEAVPAALERLARAGSAAAFAARVPPIEAARLARAVAAAFGVEAACAAALGELPLGWSSGVDAPSLAPAAVRAHAPWSAALREAPALAALAPEQEAFVGVSLALRRAPAEVRTPAFATAARAWRIARSAVTRDEVNEQSAPEARAAPNGEAIERGDAATQPAPARPARGLIEARSARTRRRPRGGTAAPRRTSPPAPKRLRSPAVATPTRARAQTPAAPPQLDEPPLEAERLAAEIATQLGGLFHLVLIAQLLGLYGDFTSPARPGIRLDVWDFVTLLGRRLLVRPPRDPVWALLADLAGRKRRDPPGRGFRPPRAWRVPRAWLEPFGDARPWSWAERDGRLLLLHPAGFAVVDAPGADLQRELRRYRVACARAKSTRSTTANDLDCWVEHLAAYVRARLALALGVPPREAVQLALRRPATVFVTDTRVDVVSNLGALPIEVRVAGLDRDPGFVPAAGRSLAFHFR